METEKINITDSDGQHFEGTGLPLAERRLLGIDYGEAETALYRILNEETPQLPEFLFVIRGKETRFEMFDSLEHLERVAMAVVKHALEVGNTLQFPLMDAIRVSSENYAEFIPVYQRLIEHDTAIRAEQGPPPIRWIEI